jgi:hypothetical protein
MTELATQAGTVGAFFGGGIFFGVICWFGGLWYGRGGKAKVDAELARVEAKAKANGWILNE